MITLEKIKKLVDADMAVAGEDFHQRIYERLRSAMEKSGLGEDEARRLEAGPMTKRSILGDESFTDIFEPQIKELEDHLCLSDEYPIPSHRTGLAGFFNRLVKWTALKIKLKTDIQVSQQAKFNLAALVLARLTAVHMDLVKNVLEEVLEKTEREKTEREKEIAELSEEIARLKERLDGR